MGLVFFFSPLTLWRSLRLLNPVWLNGVGVSEAEGGRPLHGGSHLSQDRRGAAGRVQQADHRCHHRDGGATMWWVAAPFRQRSNSRSCRAIFCLIHCIFEESIYCLPACYSHAVKFTTGLLCSKVNGRTSEKFCSMPLFYAGSKALKAFPFITPVYWHALHL